MTQTNTPTFTTRRSVSTIMVDKVLDGIQNATMSSIINRTMLCLSALLIWMGLMFPEQIVTAIKFILSWHNFATIKLIFSFLIVWNYDHIIGLVRSIKFESKNNEDCDTVEGIPVIELLDHLFEFKSFKRDDVEKKFAVPRHRFTNLAQKFEDLGILVRGANNSRVLCDDFSRQDVAMILSGKSKAMQLNQTLRAEDETTFTAKPIGKQIKAKRSQLVDGIDTPPSFTSRRIANYWETASNAYAADVQL